MKQHNFNITENLQLLLTHYLDKYVPESKLERFEQFKIQFDGIGAKNLLYYQCVLIEYEWYVHFKPDYSLFSFKCMELNSMIYNWPKLDVSARSVDDVKIVWFEMAYMWLQMANICDDCCRTGLEDKSVLSDGIYIMYCVGKLKEIWSKTEDTDKA